MMRKVLLSAALIIAVAAAPAAAQYPGFVITPGTARPGDTISFNGSGCLPGEKVAIVVQAIVPKGQEPLTVVVTHVYADANGNFSGSLVVPDLPPGRYKVLASCGIIQSAELEILASNLGADPDGGTSAPDGGIGAGQAGRSGGPLPQTGSALNAVGLLGLGLLAAGGLILLATRTRGTRTA